MGHLNKNAFAMYYESSVVARHYDSVYEAKRNPYDISFYLELAKNAGGSVLEIACGTGRILLEIARAGIAIDGLDYSRQFLNVLENKLAGEPEGVRDRVNLHCGDMRDFDLGKKYDLVTIPFRPMQHMYSVDDQIKALKSAKKHLSGRTGLLAFDVFYPIFTMLNVDLGVEKLELEWEDRLDPARTVRRFFVRHSVNLLEQYFEGEFIFRTYEGEEMIEEERAPLKMSYYTYPHMKALFEYCDLEIVEEYGSFEKEPIQICKEMIFVLRSRS